MHRLGLPFSPALLCFLERRQEEKKLQPRTDDDTVNHATNHRFLIAFGKRLEQSKERMTVAGAAGPSGKWRERRDVCQQSETAKSDRRMDFQSAQC